MKRYLVPYDGSKLGKAALSYAVKFAGSVPGSIDIIYIADERVMTNPIFDLTVLALQGLGPLGDIQYRQKAKLELKAKLVALGEDLLDGLKSLPELNPDAENPVAYATRVEVANPIKFLIEASENYDVIFMGLWGEMQKLKAGLWGSTSEAVIRKGECPVFLATSEFTEIESIIIGFDNRPRARQALAWVGMIGESMSIPVEVVVCGSDKDWRWEIIQEADKITESYDTEFSYNQSSDRTAKALLQASEDHPGSLVCMGAFGDKPLREFFLGSAAEEVLRHSSSPVMLFK